MRIAFNVPNRALAAGAFVGVGFLAGAVLATSFPSAGQELQYSGLITDSSGAPRLTTEIIDVELFASSSGGDALCGLTDAGVDLAATSGRFSVLLPAACADVISERGDVWVQVTVGSTSLPRQRLRASPYAIAARDAQNADFADKAASVSDGAIGPAQLSAALTATVDALGARLTSVESNEVSANGSRYSLGAVYRGSTSGTTKGQFGATAPNGTPLTGYRAAKNGCENTLNSATAHICTGDEMARSAAIGLVPASDGWIATGTSYSPINAAVHGTDCNGWTDPTGYSGATYWSSNNSPQVAACSSALVIHCCD